MMNSDTNKYMGILLDAAIEIRKNGGYISMSGETMFMLQSTDEFYPLNSFSTIDSIYDSPVAINDAVKDGYIRMELPSSRKDIDLNMVAE